MIEQAVATYIEELQQIHTVKHKIKTCTSDTQDCSVDNNQ